MKGLGIRRRSLLASMLAVGMPAGCASGPGRMGSSPLVAPCRDLFLFGLPVLEMSRARDRTMGPRPNVFRHVRRLASASSRLVTTPNSDTLYSSAWIDLRDGAVEISVPATDGRYFSLALLDMFSNNFHVFSGRATVGQGHRFVLLPPDATPRQGQVRAPSWWVWVQARTLVLNDHDLANAHAVQDGLRIAGPSGGSTRQAVGRELPAHAQLADILRLLETEAPPTPEDGVFVTSWTSSALSSSAFTTPDPLLTRAAEEGVNAARVAIERVVDDAEAVGGWIYPRPSIGNFGADYLYRASIATWGLGALPASEAMYMRASGMQANATFDGSRSYRLLFPAGSAPPVEAFWSISLYEALPGGELFFFDNPLQRFAIGDRTEGLRLSPGGALEIIIAPDDPGEAMRPNWLPCPRGPFALIMRAYRPAAALVLGNYRLPPIESA